MAIKQIFKVSRKTFFDPSQWLGLAYIKASTKSLVRLGKAVFLSSPGESAHQETFAQAVQRLSLSEQDIDKASHIYFMFALALILLGVSLAGYGIYLWFNKLIADGIIALAITVFLFGQAFKYHFWHFQIKHRKLGCTFDEWRSGKVQMSERGQE